MQKLPYEVTYAQNREDIILDTILNGVRRGFYVDIGANHPTIDSVTKRFYLKGWRGINIEPIERLHKLLEKERKGDINLQCGIGLKPGTLSLREYKKMDGHSTFSKAVKAQHPEDIEYIEHDIPIKTLKEVFEEHISHNQNIDFLKVDVEGLEYEVLKGNDWHKYRPTVLCIEINHIERDWHKFLHSLKYELVYNDGLNEYYLEQEKYKGFDKNEFLERLIINTQMSITAHQHTEYKTREKQIKDLITFTEKQDAALKNYEREFILVKRLSLKNKPFTKRLKIVAYGLTKDWWDYKKDTSPSKNKKRVV